jgi:hypothetical protein
MNSWNGAPGGRGKVSGTMKNPLKKKFQEGDFFSAENYRRL